MTHEHDHLVEDVPLLARLRKEDLQALASRGTVRRYRTGTVIFHEGSKGDSLHVIVEGAVRISMLSARGEEATLAILGPGEYLGAVNRLTIGNNRANPEPPPGQMYIVDHPLKLPGHHRAISHLTQQGMKLLV